MKIGDGCDSISDNISRDIGETKHTHTKEEEKEKRKKEKKKRKKLH